MKITFLEVRNVDALIVQNELESWFSNGMVRRIERMNFYPGNFDVEEYLSNYLYRTGGWIQALSPHLDRFDQEVVWYTGKEKLEEILDDAGRIILLSVSEAVAYPIARQFVDECRKSFPQHPVWVGGLYASMYPDLVARELKPDLLFVGEADSDIRELVNAYVAGQTLPERLAVSHCPPRDLKQDWTLSLKYSAPLNCRTPFVLTCRDCVFDCAFCSIIKKGVMRQYSLAELESSFSQLVAQPDEVKLYIESPLPLASAKWADNLTQLLGKLEVTWYCDSRVMAPSIKTQRMFEQLYNAGCRDIYFGTETFDQSVHERMGKGIRVEHIVPLARQARHAGINVHTGWIVGFPGQTVESARRDIDLVTENLAADVFSTAEYTYLAIFPGTRLYSEPEKFGVELIDWDIATMTNHLCYRTSELTTEQIWNLYLEGLQKIGKAQGF